MAKGKKGGIRAVGKDGTYATIEAYRKKTRAAQGRKPAARRYRQPERTVVPIGARRVREGSPHDLGATVGEGGINFAVHSRHARDVFLLLYAGPEGPPTDVIRMPGRTGFIRHCFVEGLAPGQLYAYKARGDFDPSRGLRFNENKLLLDPYARAFAGSFRRRDNLMLAYDPHAQEKDAGPDNRDDSAVLAKCMAYRREFAWGEDTRPGIPMAELILYETHVKGFTAHPSSGVEFPGTYLGFIGKIPYLKELGVNAVELLPVQRKFTEDHLAEKGLDNYWGYNTIGFFAPEPGYATGRSPGCEVEEFKTLVRELHKAGIEVILDVVYNHTPEGNELGPTLSFKGLDNSGYYALTGNGREPLRYYRNHTGTGNTLDFGEPAVVRLVLDSLRYWAVEMHVDGFRFDLATCLGRGYWTGFEPRAPFFQALAQDPVLSRLKMIAEPWDVDEYALGRFPVNWSEWNGKFRDNARRFIKGDGGQLNELGWRLTGSADLFGPEGRTSDAAVNFITCHDGFTLRDLVSYNEKHNEANQEGNRDGGNENLSWNCGAEGETQDEMIKLLRRRQVKNFFCLLLFAQGVPMINAGDEIFRTQSGNNNAYCQDNPVSWVDWGLAEENADLLAFVRKAIALRKRLPLLRGKRFLEGADADGNEVPDIAWFGPAHSGVAADPGSAAPAGAAGGAVAWNQPESRALAFQLDGYDGEPEAVVSPIRGGGRYYFIFNAESGERDFSLPVLPQGSAWRRLVDTSLSDGDSFLDPGREETLTNPLGYRAKARSVVVLVDRVEGV